MNKNVITTTFGILLALALLVLANSLFIVTQRDQALVLRFGEYKRTVKEPGLHFKVPFLDNVLVYDARVLDLDPPAESVLLSDQKRLEIDTFARYRIEDPLKFYQAVRSESTAQQRLNTFVNSALREQLGKTTLVDLLSAKRDELMNSIRDEVNKNAQPLGMAIVDVRIRQADLPVQTSEAIYQRMRSERQREAAEFRAQGEEQAQQIRSHADREVTVIEANAQRDADIIRGEGDKQAIKIYADAYNKDADFYAFYRSLQAYRQSLANDDTTMLLSPDSEFFRYFNSIKGKDGSLK